MTALSISLASAAVAAFAAWSNVRLRRLLHDAGRNAATLYRRGYDNGFSDGIEEGRRIAQWKR